MDQTMLTADEIIAAIATAHNNGRLEGIRMGLEAAARAMDDRLFHEFAEAIRKLSADDIARGEG